MISQEKSKALIDAALSHGKGRVDGMEVSVDSSNIATSRFANNNMTQNQSPSHVTISVRVQHDGRQARQSSDRISEAAVRQVVDDAILAASFSAKDESMLPIFAATEAAAHTEQTVNRLDLATAEMTPMQRALEIKKAIDYAKGLKLTAAGVYVSGAISEAIGNSAGLFQYHCESSVEVSLTMKTRTDREGNYSTGWSKANSTKSADIDILAMAEEAAETAVKCKQPGKIKPGKYTVILKPSAVLDMVSFLWGDFTGTSVEDKLSCFVDQAGKKVAGDNISIKDDAFHVNQAGAPFDGEGVPRSVVQLIEGGTLKNFVYGRRSAKKANCCSTGHGLQEPSAMGEYPLNLVVSGGDSSLAEMIKSTKRGLLLARVWYVREVDPRKKIVTGMTRDGVLLIIDGKIVGGVRNMRFNQSILEMLKNAKMLGASVRAAGEEGFPAVVPAMVIENFNFSSVSPF